MEAQGGLALRRLASPLGLLLALVLQAQGQQPLSGHTIGHPPNVNSLATDWFLGGTVIPSMRSLVLSPGVPNRLGMMWSRYPLLTADFEVTFTITAKSPDKRTAKEDGLAFWYVYENASAIQSNMSTDYVDNQESIIANSWGTALDANGLDLFGYRSLYDGLGVFLCGDMATNAPQVSALANNGKMPYKLNMGVPTADALKFDFHGGKEVTVKVRVQPTGAKVEVVGHGTIDVKGEFRPGGYLGMTIYGGKKGMIEATERSDMVELKSFTVVNHDKAAAGESVPEQGPTEEPKKDGERTDLLADTSSFKDHRAESDAIKDLTNMVFKLIVESEPMRKQMTRAIDSLGRRISTMEKTFEDLKSELDKKSGHKLGDEFEAIKKELTSLSTVATKETKERHNRLDTLHKDISDVHKSAHSPDNIDLHLNKLTESNQKTLESLTNEHQKMFGVSLAAIAFIIIAGLSLYNKFRCWEKKHIL